MFPLLLSLLLGCGFGGSPDKDGAGPKKAKQEKAAKKQKGGGKSSGGGGLLPTDPMPDIPDPCAKGQRGSFLYPFQYEGTSYDIPLYIGSSEGPRDLVVLLHGGGGGAASILKKTRMHKKAMAEGFVAVAPEGADLAGGGARWNSGKFDEELKKRLRPGEVPRDDVAFLDALAKKLEKDACIDHVTVVGFSSGGQMAHLWACKGTEVDAVFTSAGELLSDDRTCKRAVPVLGFVGTEDDVYTRGPNPNDPSQPSAPETIDIWSKNNQCKGKPAEKKVEDATCFVHKGCKAPTQLCVIDGMPHAFPAPWGDRAVRFDGSDYGWTWVQGEAKGR